MGTRACPACGGRLDAALGGAGIGPAAALDGMTALVEGLPEDAPQLAGGGPHCVAAAQAQDVAAEQVLAEAAPGANGGAG